jgi:hypothetical protein
MAIERIRFNGHDDLILVDRGSITTIERFERFECSYAHLFPDAVVRRFGVEIGKESDIEVLNEVEAVCGSRAEPGAIADAALGGWKR